MSVNIFPWVAFKNTLLGSDGLKISHTYNLYLQKCETFVSKARQYKIEQARCRRSAIQSDSPGYEPCDCHERHALQERGKSLKVYHDSFDSTNFGEDKDSMYECFTGKTKTIRIIRELSESKPFQCEESSDDQSWFLRFCTFSRFIQAVRMVILKQRLEKRLNILKRLTPAIINELEGLDESFEEKSDENKDPCILANPLCPALCSV